MQLSLLLQINHKMFKRKRQADTDSRKAGNPLSSVELLERSSGHSPCNLPSNTPRGQRPRNINFRKTTSDRGHRKKKSHESKARYGSSVECPVVLDDSDGDSTPLNNLDRHMTRRSDRNRSKDREGTCRSCM